MKVPHWGIFFAFDVCLSYNIVLMKKRSLSYYLGTFFIIASLIGFVFIFYPVLSAYIFPRQLTAQEKSQSFILTIPTIKAEGVVLINVDPFNKDEYMDALKRGIAHAKNTSLPGERGTVFLFAHSSGMPWEITRYNSVFLRLNELQLNNEIKIMYEGKEYTYVVKNKKEVFPTEVNYLLKESKHHLILQTCTPIGTDWKRLLIFADIK